MRRSIDVPLRSLPPRRVAVSLVMACSVVALGCEPPAPPPPPPEVRPITFPVEGGATFVDSFGAPRGEGRTHGGQDLMAPKMQPVLAAAGGTVTWLRYDNASISGNLLVIADPDGWIYTYVHLNNDTPGTDDGRATREQVFAPRIEIGATVEEGQVVAYVGDSGNAENAGSHLHFEMRRPDGTAFNPYQSLLEATIVK